MWYFLVKGVENGSQLCIKKRVDTNLCILWFVDAFVCGLLRSFLCVFRGPFDRTHDKHSPSQNTGKIASKSPLKELNSLHSVGRGNFCSQYCMNLQVKKPATDDHLHTDSSGVFVCVLEKGGDFFNENPTGCVTLVKIPICGLFDRKWCHNTNLFLHPSYSHPLPCPFPIGGSPCLWPEHQWTLPSLYYNH